MRRGERRVLRGVGTITVEHAPASSHPTEATPHDVVHDVAPGHEVTVYRDDRRLTLVVTDPKARPETEEVLVVSLDGAMTSREDAVQIDYTGVQFARGNAWEVTLTVYRQPDEASR